MSASAIYGLKHYFYKTFTKQSPYTKITDNEYKLRKFWNNTKLHWSNLYNEETDTEFFAVLQSTNMKYLYDYELILDQTSKLRDIQQYMNMFIDDGLLDIDSFKQNFQDLYDSTRIMEDTKRNKEGVNKEFAWTKNTVTALIGHCIPNIIFVFLKYMGVRRL